jgi:anti-sigma B factor antagonist
MEDSRYLFGVYSIFGLERVAASASVYIVGWAKVVEKKDCGENRFMQLTTWSLLPMSLFRFEHRPERKELCVHLTARQFTAATVPEFKTVLEQEWKPEINRVVLDLTAVEFIDSSGVGALLGVQKRLSLQSEPVTLKGVRPTVVRILELLRLQRVFKLE